MPMSFARIGNFRAGGRNFTALTLFDNMKVLKGGGIMYFDVASVVANNDFTLSLVFEDGKSGIYDMKPLIGKGPWEHLASLSFFKTVSIDCGTAVWPGDIDIAPEELYENCIA